MKALMILGAIIGFLTGVSLSLATECAWDTTLWRASVAALGGALLTRWWGGIWLSNLEDALAQPPAATGPAVPKPAPTTTKV